VYVLPLWRTGLFPLAHASTSTTSSIRTPLTLCSCYYRVMTWTVSLECPVPWTEGQEKALKQDYPLARDARSAAQEQVVKVFLKCMWLPQANRKALYSRPFSTSSAVACFTSSSPASGASSIPPSARTSKTPYSIPWSSRHRGARTSTATRRSGDPGAGQAPRGARDAGGGHLLRARPRELARARRGLAGRARRGRAAKAVAGQDGEAGVRAC
jgi:hypothetical protein